MGRALFEGTNGPRRARIAIIGEAWGEEEERAGQPFVGSSGKLLNSMLHEAGISREECFASNIVCARPLGNEMWRFFEPKKGAQLTHWDLHPLPLIMEGLDKLERELREVNPDVILSTGNYPFWATSSEARTRNGGKASGGRHIPTGIGDFRGSMLRGDRIGAGKPVLPIIHPAAVMRDWTWRSICVQDLRNRVPRALRGEWDPPARLLLHSPTFTQAVSWLDGLYAQLEIGETWLSVDIETRRQLFITCIGLAYNTSSGFCLPLVRKCSDGGLDSYWTTTEESALVRYMAKIFSHPNVRIIGQNFNYDKQYFYDHWRMNLRCDHDTMQAQHLLFPGTPKSLGHLSSIYCAHHRYWKDDNKDWDAKSDLTSHFIYNAEDAVRTLEVAFAQMDLIRLEGLGEQWLDEMDKHRLAFKMMVRGVRIDRSKRQEMNLYLLQESEARIQRLMQLVPQCIVDPDAKSPWYSSPAQTMHFFYDVLGLPKQTHKKTGAPTFDKTAIATLKKKAMIYGPIFELLEELRSLGVLRNTFIEAPLDPDGRMRCSFNTTGTYTFRWSSSENAFGRGTNLQNIPKEKNL